MALPKPFIEQNSKLLYPYVLCFGMPNYNWVRSQMASFYESFPICGSSEILQRSLHYEVITLSGRTGLVYLDRLWKSPSLAILLEVQVY